MSSFDEYRKKMKEKYGGTSSKNETNESGGRRGGRSVTIDTDSKESKSTTKSFDDIRAEMNDKYGKEYSKESKDGWQKFLDDREASTRGEEDESFWEKIGRYLSGGTPDTSLPMGTTSQVINDLRVDESYKLPNNNWSYEQKYAFGELYLSDPERAYAYAEEINKENDKAKEEEKIKEIQDSATDNFWSGAGHTLGAIASTATATLDVLNYLAMSNAGRDITAPDGIVTPFEYTEAVYEGISEHLNERGTINERLSEKYGKEFDIPVIGDKGLGDVYQIGTSALESIYLKFAGGLPARLMRSYASGLDDAKERGATDGQAVIYAVVTGTVEALLEEAGVEKLFNIKSASTWTQLFKNVFKQAGVEAVEEGTTSIINNIADNMIMMDKSNFNLMVAAYMEGGLSEEEAQKKAWKDSVEGIIYDSLAGGVSGGISAGVGTIGKTAWSNHKAKDTFGDGSGIVKEALDYSTEGSDLRTLAEEYSGKLEGGKSLSGGQINRLNNSIATEDKSRIRNAILQRLGDLGETGDVNTIADTLVKEVMGEKLGSKDWNILNESKYGYFVEGELNRENIKSGGLSNDWASHIGTRRIHPESYNKELYDLAKQMSGIREAVEKGSVDKTIGELEKTAARKKVKVSESGKTIYKKADGSTEDVTIKGIVSTKGGLKVELDNGKTVRASDLSFSTSNEALMYEMVARMDVTPDTANEIISTFKPANAKQASLYFANVPLAYQYGTINYEAGLKNIRLSEAEKRIAFNRGKADAVAKAETKTKTKTETKAAPNAVKTTKTGIVYEGDFTYDEASANELQKASMAGIEVINKLSSLEVHVFESVVENGERVYYLNGERKPAPNGYFRDGNKIYIDFNAGNNGEGAMLYTMSHEVTHYIREWNEKGFKALGDFLIAEYGKKGVPVNALIEKQKDKIKARYKREGTALPSDAKLFDMAYEEMVSDAMSDMFADPKAYEKLAKFKRKNYQAWKKLGEAIKRLLDKLKTALGIYKTKDASVAEEALYVRDFAPDVYDKLQDLYIKAFVEADANYEASNASDLAEIDTTSESVSPIMNSERTWTESEYVTMRDEAAEKIAKALSVTKAKALKYIDDINSIARMIANDRARLDYEASSFGSAFVSNVEYGGSFDYTTLCKKRRIYTGTFTEIQKRLKDTALTPDDILTIRNMLIEEGIEATCGLCYVEGSRANMGKFAKEFIRLYKRDNPNAWIPNMADVNTPDGVEQMRISHPEVYEQYVYFWNHYGKLKDSDPALFASQQKPKLYEARKEYKGEIIEHFKEDSSVAKKNRNGGIRMQSFSDFEIVHLIDTMQVIMDMSTVGLAGQAYTKVPEFAKAFGNTGLKINLSLIAKGVDADGNLIFDDREGMSHQTAFELRDRYSKNVGTILVAFTDEQLRAAMADPRIDFIIPFHRSQWKKGQYGAMGLPKGTKDYTYMQNEKLIKKTYHEYRGRMVLDKASNYMPNEYWDFSKSGKENAETYLKMCAKNNKRPKFYKLLDYDGKGTYSLKADGSTDGYWKLLIDFKMYDNDGIGSPQEAVTPTFNMDETVTMLDEYKGGHASYPVAHGVVDKFVNQYESKNETKFSDRDTAYMDAYFDGDEDLMQEMVDEAAREAGYKYKAYHRTENAFTVFDLKRARSSMDIQGFYFSADPYAEMEYGSVRYDTYLKMDNPYIVDSKETQNAIPFDMRQGNAGITAREWLQANGYDGVIRKAEYFGAAADEYIVFDSSQIKSAEPVTYADDEYGEGDVIPLSERFNSENSDIRYSDRDGNVKNATELSEEDLKYLLESVQNGAYSNSSYIPLRRNTPEFFIGVVTEHSKGMYFIEDYPMAATVEHLRQNMEEDDGRSYGNHRPHGLSIEDIITISREMGDPSYIVLQKNGRYAEVVSFYNKRNKKVVVAIDVADSRSTSSNNYKYSQYMNGYNSGYYNIIVTQYEPDSFETYLKNNTVVYDKIKMNGRYQVGSGRIVTVTHDTPFIEDMIPHLEEKVKSENSDTEEKHSERDSYAPTFYSHMGKVIDDIRIEKMGAGGVASYLKGKGVKDEEIKWSGIEAFLEGKKSVTKAELQEFVAGSQLRIEEEMSSGTTLVLDDGTKYNSTEDFKTAAYKLADENGIDHSRIEFENYDDEAYVALVDGDIDFPLLEAAIDDGGSRWSEYKLDGGTNYRELVFTLPNEWYSNDAMRVHWGRDAEGVLAHARIQDMTTADGKKMLFIEELQSDWHNEGHRSGYIDNQSEAEIDKLQSIADERYFAVEDYSTEMTGLAGEWETIEKTEKGAKLLREYRDAKDALDKAIKAWEKKVPDAPFRDTYHEYVLKRLLRMAAEEGYDSIGWTPALLQSMRWGERYAEGYRIEYDQDIPKFLRKYGKKWGATVGKTALDVDTKTPTYVDANNNKYRYKSEWFDSVMDSHGYSSRGHSVVQDGKTLRIQDTNTGKLLDESLTVTYASEPVWSMDIPDSMTESVLYEGQVMYSERVTDKKTLDFLENQEHITTYKSFVEIDGKLYSPMATKVKGDDGKYHLTNASEIGVWQQAEEKPDSIPKFHKSGYGYYVLKKDDGGSITAAYNPYEHSSNLVLNDQFESAYQRPNLVTVECVIPKSEMTSGYKAKFAKDSVGYLDWKSGTVAGKLKGNKRKVYLSRWLKPVRILSDAEVASMYKDILGTKISVPFNVVTPQLLTELEKVGVKIDHEGSPGYQYRQSKKATDADTKFSDRDPNAVSHRTLLANALESTIQNEIERNKLAQYKAKIALIESEQAKLDEIRAKAKELRFKKGRTPDETKMLRDLDAEATQIANRISTYDKQLLNLESTTALKNVLEREKAMLRRRLEQKSKESLKAHRERAAKTQRELMNRYQDSRKKAIEGRNKTEMRRSIIKLLKRLNKLFKGGKERNVKEGMKETVATALALGEALFNNNISNKDIVNLGVESVTEKESKLLNEYRDILIRMESNNERIESIRRGEIKSDSFPYISELEAQNRKYETRIARLNKELSDLFIRERAKLNRTPVSTLIYNLALEYHSLRESKDEYIKRAYEPELFNKLIDLKKDLDGVVARDMNMHQLETVHKVFTMIEHSVRTANQFFRNGKFEDLQTSASAIMEEVEKLVDTKQISSEMAAKIKSYLWNELTPYYAFDKIGSQTLMTYFADLMRGQRTVARDSAEAKLFAEETRRKHNYSKWDLDKVYDFKLKDGRTFSTTLKHLLSVYAYSKRAQADAHMSDGGFFHNDKATFRKVKGILKMVRTDAIGYKVDADILAEIKTVLGDEKTSYVDEMLDYLTKIGEKGNEVTRIMWGVDIFTEKVYFPLKSKDDFLKKSTETAQAVSLKNDGMTKETIPGASNPIVLEAFDDVWANHVERMSLYHGLVVPLDNLNKVLHYGTWAGTDSMSVSTMLEGKFTSAVTDYLEQFINDLNGGVANKGAANPFASFFGKFKKTVVGASVSTMVQQPTAVIRAMAEIDMKYFVGKPNHKKISSKWDELKTYAPVAIIKEIGGFDAGGGKQVARWINSDALTGIDKVMNTVDDVSMKGAEIADVIGWVTIWEAVKRETKATTNLAIDSEEFLEKCGERFEEVITKTQVYDSTLSRSGFMRSKNDGVKMLTSFMGEPTLSINMLYNAVINAKRGGKGTKAKAARTIAFVYASIILAEALSSAIYALRDDDEDESYLEKYLQAFGSGVISDIVLAPITSLPGVKDIVSIFQGWDIERSDMAIFKDIKDAFDGLGSENKSTYRKIEDFAGAIAAAFGLPLKNVLRTGREIYNAVENSVDGISGGNAWDAFKEGVTGKDTAKHDSLYDAIVNGDESRLAILKKTYKDNNAYETAIRKALRENDPRIKEAAQADVRGDVAKRVSITKAIIAEGHFSQDTVVASINAEISAIKRGEATVGEDTEDNNEATSMYKSSDINVAFDNGDNDLALDIIDDLIDTKVANGKTEKEAKSSLRSSMTSYWKPLYKQAYQSGNISEMERIRRILYSSGLYGSANDVVKTAKEWLKD